MKPISEIFHYDDSNPRDRAYQRVVEDLDQSLDNLGMFLDGDGEGQFEVSLAVVVYLAHRFAMSQIDNDKKYEGMLKIVATSTEFITASVLRRSKQKLGKDRECGTRTVAAQVWSQMRHWNQKRNAK